MGFARDVNGSLRYVRIEKSGEELCGVFFWGGEGGLNYVKASLMLVDAPLKQYRDAPY